MELASAHGRAGRWQRPMAGVILFTLAVRLVMQAYPPLESVYAYVLALPYVAFAALVLFDSPMLRDRGFRLMLLCLLWAALCCLPHAFDRSGIQKLFTYFLMMLFGFCMCYPLAFVLPTARVRHTYAVLAGVFCIGITLLCAVGCYAAVMRVTVASFAGAGFEPIGVTGGRLSIFAYPTVAATFCGLALLLLQFLFFDCRRRLIRVLCILMGLIVFVALALTAGRFSSLFVCACLGGTGYLLASSKLRVRKRVWRVIVSLLLAAAVMAAGYALLQLSTRGVAALSSAISPQEASADAGIAADHASVAADGAAADAASVENRSLLEGLSTLQGRTYAWEGAVRALKSDPLLLLFGASPVHVMERVDPFVQKDMYPGGYFHLHSIVLQTLMSFGVIGLLLFAAMTAMIVYHAVRVFCSDSGAFSFAERTLPLLLAFCLGVDLLETFLSFSDVTRMVNPWFFLTAGYVVRLSRTRLSCRGRVCTEADVRPECHAERGAA